MLIEQIFPQVVEETGELRAQLLVECTSRGMPLKAAEQVVALVPEPLSSAGAFLDRITRMWRYEFGEPYSISSHQYWGTHMWVPVRDLATAVCCANQRLPPQKREDYLARLAVAEMHQVTLVEMIPAQKVSTATEMEFEVEGLGQGKRTVDWVIHSPCGRRILLDVKRRAADFIAQAEGMSADGEQQEPVHDPALLFRSLETKLKPADPCTQLQGAWICTDIKQNEESLVRAFAALSEESIHFAVLGDWENDAFVLGRRPEDVQFLMGLFNLAPSNRFTFRAGNES